MEYIIEGIKKAVKIILSMDREFISIVFVSIKVSFTAIFLATLAGLPCGIGLGIKNFKGRKLIATIFNTLLSLPTVVVGLILYSLLSRRGPFGHYGLLFSPAAMIMGQFILAFPIVTAITMNGIKDLGNEALIAAKNLGAGKWQSYLIYISEVKFIIMTSILAGFGRVFAEVGVSMMLGGNIRLYTRNITTAIALEISKGAFSLGIALGLILLIIAFTINFVINYLQSKE